MGTRMRAFDWTSHPLGEPHAWPQSLKSAVSICLGSRFPILLWWGPELFMLYNDAYRPMLGMSKHPMALGQAGRACWPEIWHIIGPMLEDSVLRRGEATWSNDQLLLLERNGFVEECYFTFTYSPIRDESGGVGGVFCAVIETTERVVGERRLRVLKDLAANTIDGTDADDVCRRAMSVIGDSHGDLPFAGVFLFDDDGRGRLVARTTAGPDALPTELLREDSGSLDLTEPAIAVPIAASGQSAPTGLLVAGLNPQRLLDSDYRSFIGLVAGQIGSSIADARALEAERRRAESLAELDRAKTAFFSNVSHEFRTPLTLLLGPVQDALTSPSRTMDEDALGAVHRNALRLLKLVNTLLDFARLEAGRAEATYEPTDLTTFTRDLAGAFRSAVESAGLRFEVDCDRIDQPVYVDRSMWEKIVFNLLSNALKFTFEGTIRLALSANGNQVQLSVSDTGVGIEPDQIPRVFERFNRVRGTRARTHEGSGIGLALVQELVRLHGGTIRADSGVGVGTTVTVSLPMGTAHLPPEAIGTPRALSAASVRADVYVNEALGWVATAQAGPSRNGSSDSPARPRILLADDNADMRDYVSRLLGERWDVEAVADGSAALNSIRGRCPDILVTDVMMPGLDGFELLAAVRADPATQGIPVVLVSARAGEEAALGAIAAGADDYLVKPFTARDLIARIEAQLGRAQARAAIRERMAQIEAVLNHAPLGVYLVDQNLRIVHVNPIARPVFGDIPDLEGRDFDEVLHRLWTREYADEVVRLFRQTLDTGEPHIAPERAEYRIDRGTVEYYEWRVVRIPLPDGEFGVVCYFREISQQVRARLTIAESEERYRTLVSVIADVPWATDPGGAFVAPQAAWSDYTGQTWAEMRGLGWKNALHPDDREHLIAKWLQACDTGHAFEAHGRLWHAATAEWRRVISRATPVRDVDGAVREWVGAYTDVHERAAAEAALRESEQRFRAFVTATSDAVYRMSADWQEMRDLDGRQFVADTTHPSRSWMNNYIHPDDQAEVRAAIDAAIRTKSIFELEHRVTRVDGTLGWAFSRAIPLLDADGKIVEWFGTAREVTDRKRADEAVERLTAYSDQQRRLYRTILSSTPDLVYVFGLDHRFTYANDALLAMWGRTWDEAIGKNCLELGYEPWHAAMHDREIDQVIATKQPIRGEVPFSGTNGRRFYDYIFVPVLGDNGEVEAIAGSTRDVTDRRLTEDSLRESERRLADANRVKDEFLATLSHELRTPLNAVLGWAHMLRTGTLRPELYGRALESLERNAKAQAQLVDDLLDVSRIMSGKLPIRSELLDLRGVISGAIDAVRPGVSAKHLQLRAGLDADADVLVHGDPNRLQQVVWNLLANAVKFTPAGGTVDVDLQNDGTTAEIIIRDTGEGIDRDFLPYVFDRFRQADSAPSRRHGGLGLGLAIVRHLTEAHGGSVAVHSDGPGTGATFTVRLPVAGVRERPRPGVAPVTEGKISQRIAGIRVLVTDDEADARELARVILERHGAEVVTAASAGEALYAIEHRAVDLLVADIGMPEQDGYALIRIIRSLPEPIGRTPAIAVTAYASLREREDALAAGYDSHLGKPIDPEDLVAAVVRAVDVGAHR